MIPEKGKNEIPMVLTNNSALVSSTVSLFSLGNIAQGINNGALTSGQRISVTNASFSGTANWVFTYNVSLTESISDPTDIDDLLTKLNAVFTENGEGIFWKQVNVFGVSWYLNVASSAYVFVNEQHPLSPINTFADFATNYISGTTISVEMQADVTYNSVCVDMTSQPYLITSIYVYSSNQSQISKPFSVNKLSPNGTASTRPVKPQLSPTQEQNVQAYIPIYMTTSATNQLQYTLLARAEVTMIVSYENISLYNALELLNSGEFRYEMDKLKKHDEEEYNRIMRRIYGVDILESMESSKQFEISHDQTIPNSKEVILTPSEYDVPLIFVVEKMNGNTTIKML